MGRFVYSTECRGGREILRSKNKFGEFELRHRISSGWAAFMSFKTELCGKHYAFEDQSQLEAVVSPRVNVRNGSMDIDDANGK